MPKHNPRRTPVTYADVLRAERKGVVNTMTMFLTVLLDKHNATPEELQIFYSETLNLADSIKHGYTNVNDLTRVLKDEYDITVSL